MKFLRKDSHKMSKLGKRRKSKQVWRRPKGRDNKMRERKKGHPASVSLGFRTEKKEREKIQGKNPVTIYKPEDLKKIGKENIAILGKVGKRKKIQILEKAKKEKISINNINEEKLLKKLQKSIEKKDKKETKTENKKSNSENENKSQEKTKENKTNKK